MNWLTRFSVILPRRMSDMGVPLYKTTIVILSDFDPSDLTLEDLARDAHWGGSYPYSREVEDAHPDQFGEEVRNFFLPDDE